VKSRSRVLGLVRLGVRSNESGDAGSERGEIELRGGVLGTEGGNLGVLATVPHYFQGLATATSLLVHVAANGTAVGCGAFSPITRQAVTDLELEPWLRDFDNLSSGSSSSFDRSKVSACDKWRYLQLDLERPS
jgi:hypothetical protein